MCAFGSGDGDGVVMLQALQVATGLQVACKLAKHCPIGSVASWDGRTQVSTCETKERSTWHLKGHPRNGWSWTLDRCELDGCGNRLHGPAFFYCKSPRAEEHHCKTTVTPYQQDLRTNNENHRVLNLDNAERNEAGI